MTEPRAIVRAFAQGRWDEALAVPLALHVAARIAERDPEDFLYDPTQLANALRDLAEAVGPDGLVLTDAAVLADEIRSLGQVEHSEALTVALEATRRLRSSYADRIALVAVIPGPERLRTAGGGEAVLAVGQALLAAGADVLVLDDQTDRPSDGEGLPLTTLANVARFHQGVAVAHGTSRFGLTATTTAALTVPTGAGGIVTTPAQLPRDTDLEVLRDWIAGVRAPAQQTAR